MNQRNHPFLIYLLAIWLCLFGGIAVAQSNLKVRKITFSGTDAFPEKELKNLLKSQEKKKFNARFANLDRILLTNYYQMRGFLNVYVDYKVNKDGDEIVLDFQVNEGKRYYLKEKNFT
ncbi:MAG: hypothetical protein KDE52_15885, partial [Calditrichaeota bacterium]|nr:hypothetical protein [Calditrichota bacterium]